MLSDDPNFIQLSQGRLFFYYSPQMLGNKFSPLGKNFKFWKKKKKEKEKEKKRKEIEIKKKEKKIKRIKWNKHKMKNEEGKKRNNKDSFVGSAL